MVCKLSIRACVEMFFKSKLLTLYCRNWHRTALHHTHSCRHHLDRSHDVIAMILHQCNGRLPLGIVQFRFTIFHTATMQGVESCFFIRVSCISCEHTKRLYAASSVTQGVVPSLFWMSQYGNIWRYCVVVDGPKTNVNVCTCNYRGTG